MGDYGVRDFLDRGRHRRSQIDAQLAQARGLAGEARKRADAAEAEADAARAQAAAVLLPSWDPISLSTAERLAGLPAGWAQQRMLAVQQEDQKLASRVAEIERGDVYQSRELYLGEGGQWTNELAAAESNLRPLDQDAARYLAVPYFREIVQSGYDTPAYEIRWWQLRYYRYWKHGDQACDALGKRTFAEVRQDWLQLEGRLERARGERDEVKKKIHALEALVKEREAALARREALRGQAPLDEARKAIEVHLTGEAIDLRALGQTAQAAGRADVLQALLRLDGLEEKTEYLIGMAADSELTNDLEAERAKLDNDLMKYGRPKKAGTMWAAAAFDKRFVQRPARYDRQLAQRRRMLDRVSAWDDWDDDDYYDDWTTGTPWWFVFTGWDEPGYGSRYDDVTAWTAARPGWKYQKPEPSDDAYDAAAAALAAERDEPSRGKDVS